MTEEHIPLVSIIMPTFNREQLIAETIRSVIEQTYTNWELIVVDDGSEDNTTEVVSTFNDSRIQYCRIEHCGFLGKVRNEGLKMARGEFIAFLDSDDIWASDKLVVQVSTLLEHKQAFFIFNNVDLIGDTTYPSPPDYENLYVGNILLAVLYESRFVFFPSAFMFRKEVLDAVGYMDETSRYGADTRFFLFICHLFDGVFINNRLVKIRKHPSTASDDHGAEAYLDSIETLRVLFDRGAVRKSQFEDILYRYYYKLGLWQLKQAQLRHAVSTFIKCIRVAPLRWKGYARMTQATINMLTR